MVLTAQSSAIHEVEQGRHRACLDLGLPVLVVVEDASDASLFEQMERENRGRKNLSAWRLAESLGVDVSLVSKSVTLHAQGN